MTLFALYMARRRSRKGVVTKEKVEGELFKFHLQSRTQTFETGELSDYIEQFYEFLHERFSEEFAGSANDWVVNDYSKVKDIVIGQFVPEKLWHDSGKTQSVSPEMTIDMLLEMIDDQYLIPSGITNPTPEHFKNLDLGGRSQIKVFLEKDTSEFDKRNQFIYILTGGEFKDRIYGATMLQKMRGDISFIAIDPRFEALFTMLSPLESFSSEDGHLLNSMVVAAGSKDNHFGYFGRDGELRCASVIGESVFAKSCNDSTSTDHYWWHGDEMGWMTTIRGGEVVPTGTRVNKVSGAVMDMMSLVTDEMDSPIHPDFDPYIFIGRDKIHRIRESHPVEHIILAGNALFALNVEKMREAGVTIPVDCVEFNDKTLKQLLKDQKQIIWESDAWDNFGWQLTQINAEMGESMIECMLKHNAEVRRVTDAWFLDISIFTEDSCRIGDNIVDIFQALNPYHITNDSKFSVKSIRAMPRVTPSEMTDEEIHRILGKLSTICGCTDGMEE